MIAIFRQVICFRNNLILSMQEKHFSTAHILCLGEFEDSITLKPKGNFTIFQNCYL
jgi:hypothetical protein